MATSKRMDKNEYAAQMENKMEEHSAYGDPR